MIRADHFSGATISYICTGGNFYKVDLDLYLNCAGVAITAQRLKFRNDCGVFFQLSNLPLEFTEEVSPACVSQLSNTTCHSGGTLPGFMRYRFSSTVFLSPCDQWNISWSICCRNVTENVLNAPGTYAEATLNNFGGLCDNSPVFADNGVPFLCTNADVSYNPGASDPDGDLMSFELISARFDSVNTVVYRPGFSGTAPLPGLTFNSVTGQLDFLPTVSGNYVVVIQVTTYNSMGAIIGSVMRDLMFVVRVCNGSPPVPGPISNVTPGVIHSPEAIAVCNGQAFCVDLVATDADLSSIVAMTSNAAALLPGSTFQVLGTNPATARICWTADLSLLPVNVFIDMSDGDCPIENTASRSLLIGSCLLLPITLVEFTAQVLGPDVALHWTTNSEMDNDHFSVERSIDGMLFNEVGRVDAIGTSQTPHRYELIDHYPQHGTNYYRLKQTDTDGTSTHSATISVVIGSELQLHAEYNGRGGWMVRGLLTRPTFTLVDGMGRITDAAFESTPNGYRVDIRNTDQVHVLTIRETDRIRSLRLPIGAGSGDRVTTRNHP